MDPRVTFTGIKIIKRLDSNLSDRDGISVGLESHKQPRCMYTNNQNNANLRRKGGGSCGSTFAGIGVIRGLRKP